MMKQVIAAFAQFGDEQVLRVSLPYGARLIDAGRFEWSILAEHGVLRTEFGDADIPLGLVMSRSVELFVETPGDPPRTAPLYMIPAGEFFGLFENFTSGLDQGDVSARAGGTSILILPAITPYVTRLLKEANWKAGKSDRAEWKNERSSSMAFGNLVEGLVNSENCSWRVELTIFPQAFVTAIRSNCKARLAITELALEQMTIACARAVGAVPLARLKRIHGGGGPQEDNIVAVRHILHGHRPGFTPVFGTARDETVLPAAALNAILYREPDGLFRSWTDTPKRDKTLKTAAGGEGGGPAADVDPKPSYVYYPAVFRPALPGDPAYYILKRPYGRADDDDSISHSTRVANLLSAISRVETRAPIAGTVNATDLTSWMREDFERAAADSPVEVTVGWSHLVDGGVVRISGPLGRDRK